nr:phosphoglycerate dehydrogenase [uncultured Shinella sp.]
MSVLVTARFFEPGSPAWQLLTGSGVEISPKSLIGAQSDAQLTTDEILDMTEGVAAWIVGIAPVTEAILARRPDLRMLARRGVGHDNIDLAAARRHGVTVTNTPGANTDTVADHTIALMLATLLRLCEADTAVRTGNLTALVGSQLAHKTVGLIGLGRIGKAVARRLTGFDTRIVAYDPYASPETAGPVDLVNLDVLLSQSDIVSLHAAPEPGQPPLIRAATIAAMKPGAILINTARAGLVDEAALLHALETRHLAGAGLDVFSAEYGTSGLPALAGHSRVVLTPHIAGSSREALDEGNLMAAQAVSAYLSGKAIPEHWVVTG